MTAEVNGLQVPTLMLELMNEGRWVHPGEAAITRVVPFLQGPVDFVSEPSQCIPGHFYELATDPDWSPVHRVCRGSKCSEPLGLPWLDVEKALFIAHCRIPGDDLSIVLDYRTDPSDPRVLATWWPDDEVEWRIASASFTKFAKALRLAFHCVANLIGVALSS